MESNVCSLLSVRLNALDRRRGHRLRALFLLLVVGRRSGRCFGARLGCGEAPLKIAGKIVQYPRLRFRGKFGTASLVPDLHLECAAQFPDGGVA